MERNFWTEENKIMDYDSLIRADLQNKLMRMDNQIVLGKDIADFCYNYDYLVVQRKKAIQFITDYAEEFIKSLETYKESVGKLFPEINNPLKVANLMALYKGREILKNCEHVRESWDQEIILNTDTITTLLNDLESFVLPEQDMLLEKVFTTKENLTQVCMEHLCSGLETLNDKGITLTEALGQLKEPVLSEKTMKSILKNSYDEITRLVLDAEEVSTESLSTFMNDIVNKKVQSILVQDMELGNTDIPLDNEILAYFHSVAEKGEQSEIEFNPIILEEKTHIKEKILEK